MFNLLEFLFGKRDQSSGNRPSYDPSSHEASSDTPPSDYSRSSYRLPFYSDCYDDGGDDEAYYDDSGSEEQSQPRKFKGAAYGVHKKITAMRTPEEKDHNMRCFDVLNPEGEVFSIDTRSSEQFFGPVWTRIFDAYEKGELLRARVALRQTSRLDQFSGYTLSIDGVPAFLPRSKSVHFYNSENDATNLCIAVQVMTIHVNGPKCGSVIVDAKPAWELVRRELAAATLGDTVNALAMDIADGSLLFPVPQHRTIAVPIAEARAVASGAGMPDYFLTGLYWKLRLTSQNGDTFQAVPVEVLI